MPGLDGTRHLVLVIVAILHLGGARVAAGQDSAVAVDTTAVSVSVATDTVATAAPAPGLPLFFTIGLGYGQRFDGCGQCPSVENDQSFSAHLSIGKYMAEGVGIGMDASVWQRGHPGMPTEVDSAGAPVPTSLVSRVGNASLTLSFQQGYIFVRAGVGVALGQQDLQDGDGVISTASGLGVGYTLGGGAIIPLASLVSIACFVNWNAGGYDLQSPTAVVERDARHSFLEAGFGLTLR